MPEPTTTPFALTREAVGSPPQPNQDLPFPQPVPGAGMFGPLDQALHSAALDAGFNVEAAENLLELIQALDRRVATLETSDKTQTDQIVRLEAALKATPCPHGNIDPATKEDVASIAVCIASLGCNCEAGYILSDPLWMPPPTLSPPQDEAAPG